MGIIKKGKDYYIQYSLYVTAVEKDGREKKKRVQKQEKIGPSRQLLG